MIAGNKVVKTKPATVKEEKPKPKKKAKEKT